jgi:hypothetical protein
VIRVAYTSSTSCATLVDTARIRIVLYVSRLAPTGDLRRNPSDRLPSLSDVQQPLFDRVVEFDLDRDPYHEKRAAGQRLAAEFEIDESQGFDLVLGYGSESAARRALVQRWWRKEVELREEAA